MMRGTEAKTINAKRGDPRELADWFADLANLQSVTTLEDAGHQKAGQFLRAAPGAVKAAFGQLGDAREAVRKTLSSVHHHAQPFLRDVAAGNRAWLKYGPVVAQPSGTYALAGRPAPDEREQIGLVLGVLVGLCQQRRFHVCARAGCDRVFARRSNDRFCSERCRNEATAADESKLEERRRRSREGMARLRAKLPKPPKRRCDQCHKWYQSPRLSQRYCSLRCRWKAQKRPARKGKRSKQNQDSAR